jgi:hypothetical protein
VTFTCLVKTGERAPTPPPPPPPNGLLTLELPSQPSSAELYYMTNWCETMNS